jgi:PEP-CTERM motif
MKAQLMVAVAVLLFASVVRADEIQTENGPLYTPAGSTITSIQNFNNVAFCCVTVVSFTFADGTGVAESNGAFGAGGYIDFTVPVSDVSFVANGDRFVVSDNLDDALYGYGSGTGAFANPGITVLDWGTYSDLAPAGISSLTYTLDSVDPVPEPSSLLLSALGLTTLIGLARRNRTKNQQAML